MALAVIVHSLIIIIASSFFRMFRTCLFCLFCCECDDGGWWVGILGLGSY